MKNFNTLILLFLCPFNLLCQKINWKIPPVYDQVDEFIDGYAVVQKSLGEHTWSMHGVIDEKGKVVLPFEYTRIIPARNQTFWVSDSSHFNRKFKLVNLKNEVIFPYKYNNIIVLDAGHSVGRVSVLDDQDILELTEQAQKNSASSHMPEFIGETIFEASPASTPYYVLLDRNARELAPPLYNGYYKKVNDTIFLAYSNDRQHNIFNLASSKSLLTKPCQGIFESEGSKLVINMDSVSYLINYKGEVEKKYPYSIVYGFRSGRAKAGIVTATKEGSSTQFHYKWGFISPDGNVVLPIEYPEVTNFDNETALVTTQNEYRILDTAFHVLFSINKDSVRYFIKKGYGIYSFCDKQNNSYIFNGSLIKLAIDQNSRLFNVTINGVIIFDEKTRKYGLLDYNGKVLLPTIFDTLGQQVSDKNLIYCKYNGKYGYIKLINKPGLKKRKKR